MFLDYVQIHMSNVDIEERRRVALDFNVLSHFISQQVVLGFYTVAIGNTSPALATGYLLVDLEAQMVCYWLAVQANLKREIHPCTAGCVPA